MWGPGVRPSQSPLLKGSPSRRPRARGRACPRVTGGPGRQTGILPVWGPGAVRVSAGGGRPGSWGARRGQGGTHRHRVGDTGACQGGLCGRREPQKPCQGGAGYGAPLPLWGGCHARPAGEFIQGGRGATPLEATGRPCQCTGGRCGRGGPHRPCDGGRRVCLPASGAAVTRAPLEESSRGGRGTMPREATGRHCQSTGAYKNGAGGADGGRARRP